MAFRSRFQTQRAVCRTEAKTGCILAGAAEKNRGLRLRILQDQPRSSGGPIIGGFHILDVGDNQYSACLEALVGRVTNADQVVRTIRRASPQCVNIVNSNLLVVEKDKTGSALAVPPNPLSESVIPPSA
jgi:hypothetical protein